MARAARVFMGGSFLSVENSASERRPRRACGLHLPSAVLTGSGRQDYGLVMSCRRTALRERRKRAAMSRGRDLRNRTFDRRIAGISL